MSIESANELRLWDMMYRLRRLLRAEFHRSRAGQACRALAVRALAIQNDYFLFRDEKLEESESPKGEE